MPVRVAVVGAAGFFGRALCQVLSEKGDAVTPVTRDSYAADRAAAYDVVVNAAMPSKRFWAKQHPDLDFIETVQKTSDLLNGWRYERFIQISSVSARCERETVYGRHKAAAEVLCERPDCFTVRLTSLYGEGMSKGALVDIKNGGPVYVDGESRYGFTHVFFAAGFVAAACRRPDLTGVREVGAKNTVTLNEVARVMKRTVQFSGPVEVQQIEGPADEYPDAREVLSFVTRMP